MAWQNTLAQMRDHGTSLVQTTSGCQCCLWIKLDLDELIAKYGEAWRAWDRWPPCPQCGKPGHYMASPGSGTPYRPLKTGYDGKMDHKARLLAFGFTRRDVLRIQRMAEAVTPSYEPPPLCDLDTPFVIGARVQSGRPHSTMQAFGQWADRELLYREMNRHERAAWASKRGRPRLI